MNQGTAFFVCGFVGALAGMVWRANQQRHGLAGYGPAAFIGYLIGGAIGIFIGRAF